MSGYGTMSWSKKAIAKRSPSASWESMELTEGDAGASADDAEVAAVIAKLSVASGNKAQGGESTVGDSEAAATHSPANPDPTP